METKRSHDLKPQITLIPIRRWLCSTLSVGKPMKPGAKFVFSILIFTLSFATKSLHAVDQAPLMYTTRQELGELVDTYDSRATSILQGDGLLGPYYDDVRITSPISRAPGYPIFLSFLYSVFGRDHFKVQLVQNVLNSVSPILIFLIAGLLVSWKVGVASGLLAGVSHHLSVISNWILPDSLPSLLILLATLLFLTGWRLRAHSYWLYVLAGALLGLATLLRPLTLMMGPFLVIVLALISVRRWRAVRNAALLSLGSFLVVAPVTINNYVRYRAFVPINIQLGLLMWEGIAAASGDRFGAVLADDEVAQQEAVIYDNPSYAADWSSPDGIQRDHDRVKKSLAIIVKNPGWYGGVMWDRMGELLKYSAHAPLVYGTGNEIERSGEVRVRWRTVDRNESAVEVGRKLSWLRPPIRALQRVTKESVLALIILGLATMVILSLRRALYLLIVPLYHLLFQSAMNTEFRYGLPIHYFLFVFAAVMWVLITTVLWRFINTQLQFGAEHAPRTSPADLSR
jgi:hypothetical protein